MIIAWQKKKKKKNSPRVVLMTKLHLPPEISQFKFKALEIPKNSHHSHPTLTHTVTHWEGFSFDRRWRRRCSKAPMFLCRETSFLLNYSIHFTMLSSSTALKCFCAAIPPANLPMIITSFLLPIMWFDFFFSTFQALSIYT